MLSFFDLVAALLVLSALFGWLNHRFIHLPNSVGLLVMGLAASLTVAGVGVVFPGSPIVAALTAALRQIDFSAVVFNGMLAFLLFAGSLGLDVSVLRGRAGPVVLLAVVGTMLSTAIVGVGIWLAAGALGQPLALPWALVFGALISPTDPVAVLAMLKGVKLPQSIEIELQGEALFNDGVGIVLFVLLLGYAAGGGVAAPTAGGVAMTVLHEVGGGLLLGVLAGYGAYRALRAIDDFAVETLITLALVAGLYALAQRLGASGPLAVVAAGLLVGHQAPQDAMTDTTKRYVTTLWTLIDEILNSVLFLLIGLEVLVLSFAPGTLAIALAAVPIVLVARLLAVAAPIAVFPLEQASFDAQRAFSHLGRRSRGHLRSPGTGVARRSGQAGHPGSDVCRRAVHADRAGIHRGIRRQAHAAARCTPKLKGDYARTAARLASISAPIRIAIPVQ